jgi:hypothetical protein
VTLPEQEDRLRLPQTPIVDQYEALRERRNALRLRCATRQGVPLARCWCYQMGKDGSHLPCPDGPLPPAPDPMKPIRERTRQLFGRPFWQQPR